MSEKNLLFIAADKKIAEGNKNNFYFALQGLKSKFRQIHVILPTNEKGVAIQIGENITLHPSPFTSKNKQEAWKMRKFMVEKSLNLNEKDKFNLVVSDLKAPLFIECKAALEVARILAIPHVTEFLNTPGLPQSYSSAEVVQKMLVKDFLQLHATEISLFRVNSLAETKIFLHDELRIPLEKILPLPPYYIDREIFKDQVLEREAFSVLFAGPLEDSSGIYPLIDAIKYVKSWHSSVKLYLVGEGSLKESLKNYVKEYGLLKNVIFLRWPVSLKSLSLQYNRVSAFIMPYFSRLNYRICLEAMSCKTPVLIAKHASNPDFLAEDHNVLQFEYGAQQIANSLKRIFENSDLAAKIAINGSDAATHFEIREALNRYAEIYLKIASGADQPRKA